MSCITQCPVLRGAGTHFTTIYRGKSVLIHGVLPGGWHKEHVSIARDRQHLAVALTACGYYSLPYCPTRFSRTDGIAATRYAGTAVLTATHLPVLTSSTCPVLLQSMCYPARGMCYALCSTEFGYDATRRYRDAEAELEIAEAAMLALSKGEYWPGMVLTERIMVKAAVLEEPAIAAYSTVLVRILRLGEEREAMALSTYGLRAQILVLARYPPTRMLCDVRYCPSIWCRAHAT
eukprot:2646436-Rhodomonas_salina.4